jgi:hypothetical protein
MLEPNREQLEIFVEAMFRHCGSDGFVSLRAFPEGGTKAFRITPISLKGGLRFLMDAAEDDARRAARDPKPIVFCPPIATFTNKDRAGEKDLAEAPVLSLELDQHPQVAREGLERLLGPPTLIVRSGGIWMNPATGDAEDKLHIHWRLKIPARGEAIAKLKRARQLATALVDGDPSNVPACHPLRWPGSWHRKAEPRLCEILVLDPDREIDLDTALAVLQAVAPQAKTNGQAGPQQHTQDQGVDWGDLVGDLLRGQSLHKSIAELAMKFLCAGMNDGAAVRLLRALTVASPAPHDQRWQDRYDDIPRAVKTARKKIEDEQQQQSARTAVPAPVFDPWQPYIVPQFPLDVLPSVARDFVAAQSEAIGCDISGMAMAVLATFSGAIDHRCELKMMRNTTWWVHPRLWVLLVANASQRKSPLMAKATLALVRQDYRLQQDYQRRLQEAKKAKQEGDEVTKLSPPEPPKRYVIHDTTVEKLGEILARHPKGTLVKADEVSGWLGSMERYSNNAGRSDRAFWLQAYDGGPYTVDRIKRGEIFIENLSVSIVGGIQPARLGELHGLTSDGLLQRFIPVMMGNAGFPQDREIKEEHYGALVREMYIAPPARLLMSDDALAHMERLRQHIFNLEQASSGLAPGFETFVGKLHGVCGTLALILHIAENPKEAAADRVEETTIEKVRRLVLDFILLHAFEFYRGAEATNGERLRRLASWILTSGKRRIVPSDLTTNVADFRGLTLIEVNERVSPLVAAGWLHPADNSPVCRSWTVNPQVHIQLAERAKSEERRKTALAKLMGSPRRSQ